ncbi:MFS transporter [Streptomyces murinus]|uniref:MFS transporter n=1 Tax=Streptomyces murinus TaxID=33900 RepID=UPI0018F464D4|nr:MFS transporter [Streptomyces murinus]
MVPTAGTRGVSGPLPIILALSLAFTVTAVDPLVLNLNMPPTMAASVLAAGRLGDAVGLKRLLKLGLVVETVVDLLSGLSRGYGFLLAMRFLAGLGMTALLGVPLALLKVSVPPKKRPVAIGGLTAMRRSRSTTRST